MRQPGRRGAGECQMNPVRRPRYFAIVPWRRHRFGASKKTRVVADQISDPPHIRPRPGASRATARPARRLSLSLSLLLERADDGRPRLRAPRFFPGALQVLSFLGHENGNPVAIEAF